MADKIFFKTGSASSLPTTKTAGQLLFAIDGTTGSIYLDKDSNTRIKFNADANKLVTARNIAISGTASSSIGTFDGSDNTTIYIPTTISGFESISTKKIVSPANTALYISPASTLYLDSGSGSSIIFRQGGTARVRFDTTGLLRPESNNVSDLGSSSYKWKNIYATTFTGALSGNATTATALQTARNITISGTASDSIGTFDGSDNTTIYMPLTIQGFNEIKTKKLTITGTEQVSHLAFSRGGWNYFTAPASGSFAFVPNGGTTTNGAGATFLITSSAVQPGEKNNTIDLGTSSYKWKNVYATTFTGALSGNATTATTLATPRNLAISDTANSLVATFNGGSNTTLYMPLTIKGFTSIESDKYVVNDKVTLQYNTTNECLEFVFA